MTSAGGSSIAPVTTPESLRRVVFLVGATAVGKTAVGIELARTLGAEILSVDSRQIYRRLEIGTAKPTREECARVRHHLIDLCEPEDRMSAARFAALFHEARARLERAGVRPLAVGGAGLYVDACLGRLDPLPPADEALRSRHRAWVAEQGEAALHARLSRVDPASAARLSPADVQRVSRALEVYELTGKPLSELHSLPGRLDLTGGPLMVHLSRAREGLYRRIEQRARAMMAAGLLDEVARLLEAGATADCPAFESIGYSEFARVLTGEISEAEALEGFILRTRRYAKRQLTWFRNRYAGIHELRVEEGEPPQQTAERIVALDTRGPQV